MQDGILVSVSSLEMYDSLTPVHALTQYH